MMEDYACQGVSSIELSAVHTQQSYFQTRDIFRRVLCARLHLSLHGTAENISGEKHFQYFGPLYEEILRYTHYDFYTLIVYEELQNAANWR